MDGTNPHHLLRRQKGLVAGPCVRRAAVVPASPRCAGCRPDRRFPPSRPQLKGHAALLIPASRCSLGPQAPCLRTDKCLPCPACDSARARDDAPQPWRAMNSKKYSGVNVGPNSGRNMSVAPEGGPGSRDAPGLVAAPRAARSTAAARLSATLFARRHALAARPLSRWKDGGPGHGLSGLDPLFKLYHPHRCQRCVMAGPLPLFFTKQRKHGSVLSSLHAPGTAGSLRSALHASQAPPFSTSTTFCMKRRPRCLWSVRARARSALTASSSRSSPPATLSGSTQTLPASVCPLQVYFSEEQAVSGPLHRPLPRAQLTRPCTRHL